MVKKHTFNQAYTLIELLVVIGIIGLILSISLAVYQQNLKAARDAERQATVNELAKVFQTYQAVKGRLPACRQGIILEKTGPTANFQLYPAGSTGCADLNDINSFFTNNYPDEIIDPSGAGNLQHAYIYDSEHYCGGGVPSPIPMVFAKMEIAANTNHEVVCPQTGGNNDGGYVTTDGEPTYPFAIGL